MKCVPNTFKGSMGTASRSYFVSTASGIRLNVQEWGAASAKICVILLHGLAEGGFVWREFAADIAADFRVLVFDLRGHGASDHDPAGDYGLDAHVADIRGALLDLGLRSCVLVGHSLGGDIVAKVAHSITGLTGVVFVDAGPNAENDTRAAIREMIIQSARYYSSVDEYKQQLSATRYFADPKSLTTVALNALRSTEDGFRLHFDVKVADILLEERDENWWWDSLKKFKEPVLLVRGQGSALLDKETAFRMVSVLPSGKLAVVPGAGHAVMGDNPSGFSKSVKPFLYSLLQQTHNARYRTSLR